MVGAEHPVLDPGAQCLGVSRQIAQHQAKFVVFGVRGDAFLLGPHELALRMGTERRMHHVVDDRGRDAIAWPDRPELVRRHDALGGDDHPPGGENAPAFFRVGPVHDGIAASVGDRHVQERDVRPQRRYHRRLRAGERIGHHRAGIWTPQVGAGEAVGRHERPTHGASHQPQRHGEIGPVGIGAGLIRDGVLQLARRRRGRIGRAGKCRLEICNGTSGRQDRRVFEQAGGNEIEAAAVAKLPRHLEGSGMRTIVREREYQRVAGLHRRAHSVRQGRNLAHADQSTIVRPPLTLSTCPVQ